MALQIPNDNLRAIGKIVALPETAIDELLGALASTTITAESSTMAENIATSVPSIPHDDLLEIIETLYSLYHVREFSEVRPARFVRDLVDAILQAPDLGLNKTEHASFVGKRFQRLLNVKTLNVLSKAVRLQREAGCVFCGAKILSDIRPVFGDDLSSGPISAVITHTLKLACHESGQHREFIFVLDQQDLVKLADVVERAQEKERELDRILGKLALPRLGV
jgi:hypothetical protein